MNKQWLSLLAADVEARHSRDVCERIFGDIDIIGSDHISVAAWFERFTNGMDELNDKEFLTTMMVKRCPCGGGEAGFAKRAAIYKENYDKSETLEEFVDVTNFYDRKKLVGNILYLTKNKSRSKDFGLCGKGCHCGLAKYADKYVSDIFCYCCTVGHTGRPFQIAFGNDIKIEFIDSLIIGGKGCTMAIHLPEKSCLPILTTK